MVHIDEQISQIHKLLSPLRSSITSNQSSISTSGEQSLNTVPSVPRPPSLSLSTIASPSDANSNSIRISPVLETSSSYSNNNNNNTTTKPSADANSASSAITDIQQSQLSIDTESVALSIPPPPSVYNRSTGSQSMVTLGLSTAPRGSVSNKIAPASPSTGSKQPLNTTFRPVSNTRYNPGRSPKPKTRSSQNRSSLKHQQQSEKSTIIELESPTSKDETNKNVPLLPTSTSTTKSGSSVFRRFMPGGSHTEKSTTSSSTLLYPPTSDDEHALSPASSGNDDDDYRPLTSSSSKHHHTLL
jgi:hypothetical protein